MLALRYASKCLRCGKRLSAGTHANYFRGVVTCEECFNDPSSFATTNLPDCTAQGAVDSTSRPMMTKKSAKAIAIAKHSSQPTGKLRKRKRR